jgi:hypothetical protein
MQELFCCPALLGQAELHFARGAVQCLTACGKTSKAAAWRLERARLRAEPCIDFKDLRHGWEAVPFQKSNAKSFPQAVKQVLPLRVYSCIAFAIHGGG